jgi:hypothetical protein
MKTDNLIIIAAAGLGLWFIAKVAQGKTVFGAKPAPISTGAARTQAINNTALPGQSGWGWQYFTDGTAIGPDGKYYSGGTEVYDPAGYTGTQK